MKLFVCKECKNRLITSDDLDFKTCPACMKDNLICTEYVPESTQVEKEVEKPIEIKAEIVDVEPLQAQSLETKIVNNDEVKKTVRRSSKK